MKEIKMIDRYLDLARELKRLWNVRVTVILAVVDAIGTITRGLERKKEELEIRRIETIQTSALLESARIPRRVC